MTTNVRPQIVTWAAWYVEHKSQIKYEEIRPFPLGAKLPIIDDCSATFTNLYYLAGAPDPNGPAYHYDGYGNTDSLAANGQSITLAQLLPGDAVIYYDGDTTVHVACIIKPGDDPLTMSHGQPSEPAYVTVSEDGRPHRFFRFAVNSRFPAPKPVVTYPPVLGNPTKEEIAKANLVRVKALGQKQAVKNGWHLWYWSKTKWAAQVGNEPVGGPRYANKDFRKKSDAR